MSSVGQTSAGGERSYLFAGSPYEACDDQSPECGDASDERHADVPV